MEPIKLSNELKPKLWGAERWVLLPHSPLLIKQIDANNDLSVQVHPDDTYAALHENGSCGKAECWFILHSEPGAGIVLGHNATGKMELKSMIADGQWSRLLRVVPVHTGDFFMIPPGTLHAIHGGISLLEVQQNSDLTYRVYDYDRLENGKPRELHTEKALDVITVPFMKANPNLVIRPTANPEFIQLCTCDHFTVWKLQVQTTAQLIQDCDFMVLSVIEGTGTIGDTPAKAGDHFLLPQDFGTAQITGELTLIISAP